MDTQHLVDTVRVNFPACLEATSDSFSLSGKGKSKAKARARDISEPAVNIASDAITMNMTLADKKAEESQDCRLALVGTVQFLAAVHGLKAELETERQSSNSLPPRLAITQDTEKSSPNMPLPTRYHITIPQVKPLSPGEILGCTAPRLPSDLDALIYIGDGRFHLESIMIANPSLPAYRYDPYSKRLTKEEYDHSEMRRMRSDSIVQARKCLPSSSTSVVAYEAAEKEENNWAVILGTLGRQGSLSVMRSLTTHLPLISTIPLLLSELSPSKLTLFSSHISVFVQTSCPRLSIDWGYAFSQPLLSPYEAQVALGRAESRWMTKDVKEEYPMDFYADESRGEWTPRWRVGQREKERREKRLLRERERKVDEPVNLVAAAA